MVWVRARAEHLEDIWLSLFMLSAKSFQGSWVWAADAAMLQNIIYGQYRLPGDNMMRSYYLPSTTYG